MAKKKADKPTPAQRDAKGRFVKGNEIWQQNPYHGGFSDISPDELWGMAQEYFEWAIENHIKKERVFSESKQIENVPRPFSRSGFILHSGISRDSYRVHWKKREDMAAVIERIELVIDNQLLDHGMAGIYNALIVSRKLGLSDAVEHTSPDGSMSPSAGLDAAKLSTDALKEILEAQKAAKDDSNPE